MAEKRKLLNEIDKCYKKIDEGFEIFDDIMAKMAEANSENQREKFQDDLKKEIKKLQRLRDQIKGWQNSSDIKDKDALSKYRKLIEHRMEIFKDVERENKTKPHSKQGLSAEDKLDPKEKEKSDTIEWLNCQIRRIQDEIDRTESKLETLSSSAETGKKRGKKDDAKRNEKEKTEELRKHLDRVKFHLMNLEVCMRMINNEKLEIKDVLSKLKEPLEMYIDALDPDNEDEPENLDPEDIYEELDFGTYLSQLGGMSMNSIDDDKIGPNNENGSHKSTSPPPEWPSQKHQNGELDAHEKNPIAGFSEGSTPAAVGTPANPRTSSESAISHRTSTGGGGGGTSIISLKLSRLGSQVSNASSSISSPLPQTPPAIMSGISYNAVAAGKMHTPPVQSTPQIAPQLSQSSQQQFTPPTMTATSDVLTAENTDNSMEEIITTKKEESSPPPPPSRTPPTKQEEKQMPMNIVASIMEVKTEVSSRTNSFAEDSSSVSVLEGKNDVMANGIGEESGLLFNSDNLVEDAIKKEESPPLPSPKEAEEKQKMPVATNFNNNNNANNNLLFNSSSSASFISPMLGGQQPMDRYQQQQMQQKNREPQETVIPAWLGASPLGMVPMTDELNYQLQSLDTTLQRCPVQMDSEKPRSYLPKMPCQTPNYYPQAPLPNADSLEYYLRLSVETLFFTFYYMEGSRAQLLAAKALKKLSWRFHTKYLMWFQRHEEPKQITDDFEQGTYVYFDFEKWVQRKKEQFTFEYKYLEDKDFE